MYSVLVQGTTTKVLRHLILTTGTLKQWYFTTKTLQASRAFSHGAWGYPIAFLVASRGGAVLHTAPHHPPPTTARKATRGG